MVPKPQHLPNTPEIAVYLLQQSVEKAVKALMVADGKDEKDFPREFSHNSMKAVLNFLERRLSLHTFDQMMDTLSRDATMGLPDATESHAAFERVKRGSMAGEFRELAVMSADEMVPLVQLIDNLHQAIKSKVRSLIPSRSRVWVDSGQIAGPSAMDYLWELVNSLFEESPTLSDEATTVAKALIDSLVSQMTEQIINHEESDIRINRDWLLSNVIMPQLWTPMSLYLLATLTYPHEASSRYPAPFGYPEDSKEALQQGKLGTQHYTEDLGIIVLLPEIHRWTRATLDSMDPMLEVVASRAECLDTP